jgi:hypothetical protein
VVSIMLQAAEPDDFQMNSRVHPKHKTRYSVANWSSTIAHLSSAETSPFGSRPKRSMHGLRGPQVVEVPRRDTPTWPLKRL